MDSFYQRIGSISKWGGREKFTDKISVFVEYFLRMKSGYILLMPITIFRVMNGKEISFLVDSLPPISLESMSSVRLMNRTDTKFMTHSGGLTDFLQAVTNDYFVQEINGSRLSRYGTVYLDTEDMQMYLAHQNGRKTREKIRVRSYVDTGQRFLEVKKKNNHGRTRKNRIPVADMDALVSESVDDFIRQQSPYLPAALSPRLENGFRRITLVNRGMTERLTIDLDLWFRNPQTSLVRQIEDLVIIELKQDGSMSSIAREVLTALQIRPVGISKYCLGAMLTNPALKRNRFKSKLIQINKVTNNQYGDVY